MLKSQAQLTEIAKLFNLEDAEFGESENKFVNSLTSTNDLGGQTMIFLEYENIPKRFDFPTLSIIYGVAITASEEEFQHDLKYAKLGKEGLFDGIEVNLVPLDDEGFYVTLDMEGLFLQDDRLFIQFSYLFAKLRLAAEAIIMRARGTDNLDEFLEPEITWHDYVREIYRSKIDRVFELDGAEYLESQLLQIDWQATGADGLDPTTIPKEYQKAQLQNKIVWDGSIECNLEQLWPLVIEAADKSFEGHGARVEDDRDICWTINSTVVTTDDVVDMVYTNLSLGSQGYFKIPEGAVKYKGLENS